jgi:predicted acylesterase/phospholipase RssA
VPVLLTAYDLQARRAVILRSQGAGTLSMVAAAHASSAAPTYFEPVRVGGMTLVDGGVFAINPAMVAFAELAGERVDVLASLGTGEHTRPLPYEQVRNWGRLAWATPILDVVFDGSSDAVDEQLGRLAPDRYLRLQTRLREGSDALDDASADNLARLRRDAQRLIADHDAEIDRLAGLLRTAAEG